MTDFHIRPDCHLCSGPIREVLRLPDTPIANEYPAAPIEGGQDKFPLYLAQCESCGHVQLPVVVDPKRLFPPDYPYQSGTSPVFREHLKEFARTVSGMIKPGGRVFEIASNDGTLLREFRALGHRAQGIDPAANYGVTDRDLVDTDQCRDFFTHKWAKYNKVSCPGPGCPDVWDLHCGVDAIVALNVFAHVDDLNDFTAGVAELLAPDGVFVLEVGYLVDIAHKSNTGVIYHEHLSLHGLWPLLDFFPRHGLHMYDAERIDQQGGSIRVFVAKKPRGTTKRLRQFLQEEPAAWDSGFLSKELRRGFAPRGRKAIDIVERIRKMRADGMRIAAFGAPAKLTTWVYALGMQSDDISAVYDDNPLKQGRFTPGLFWPIVPSAQLLIDQPDAVVLFSSNFEAEIRERFKAYRGEWIVV